MSLSYPRKVGARSAYYYSSEVARGSGILNAC
ncbi:MAG: hypothetical protein QOF47_1572 [Mycobacterium sp.]|jgi:hypothetical protein|nr:hypothetical protein [Mycobacterium sp.]